MGGGDILTRRGWLLLATLLLLLGAAAKGLLIQPRAGDSGFDAGRAVDRLGRILGDERPHPVDSAANDAVRKRLMAELTALGLAPAVREATDCSGFPRSRTVSCTRVRNVVAMIPGGPHRDALLLSAHYDSTPTGPGAADAGIGVAALLETAAVLRRERPSRPVILLFNEGEEYGLNGAAVFAERDPIARQVGKLINVEARGVTGPAIMFETDSPNGFAVRSFAAGSAAPFANSLSADFARLIPNSTDVVKFRQRGWTVLNFAITGNETRYHSPGDNLAHLDRTSVAHMGGEVLQAARQLAAAPAVPTEARLAYTDIAGLGLIALPLTVSLAALGLLTFAGLVLVHRRRAWRPLGRLALAFVASVAAAGLLATMVSMLRSGDYWRAYPFMPTLAVAATVLAVGGWLVSRAADRADRSQLRLAAWTLTLVLGAAVSAAMPGGSIYFLLGPALGLLGLKWRWLAILGALVQLVMLGELVALIELTLIDGPTWAVAPLIALIFLPFLVEVGRAPKWPHMVLAVTALALWAACLLMPRATAERPLAMTIDHVQDDATGKAVWAIAAKQAPLPQAFDRFGPWRAAPLPYNKRLRWQAPAPTVAGAPAQVTVVASRLAADGRKLNLRLGRGGNDALMLRFDDKTPVVAMGLPGRLRTIDRDAEPGPSVLRCTGRACDGMEVEVLLGTKRPVEAMLVGLRFSPPREAAPLIALRPANAQPQYSPDSTVRVTRVRL